MVPKTADIFVGKLVLNISHTAKISTITTDANVTTMVCQQREITKRSEKCVNEGVRATNSANFLRIALHAIETFVRLS